MKPTLAIGAAMLALSMSAAAAPPLEVKGVPLGANVDAVKAQWPEVRCTPEGAPAFCFNFLGGLNAALPKNRFGPAQVGGYVLGLRDGKVERIVVLTTDKQAYRPLVEALTAKYGQPTEARTETVKDGSQHPATIWKRADGQITAIEGVAVVVTAPGVKVLEDASPKAMARNL